MSGLSNIFQTSSLVEIVNDHDNQIGNISKSVFLNIKYLPAPLVSAKGDNETDDTAAFNAAIAYAIANNKNPILIPSGKYRVNLVINNNSLAFVGAGVVDDWGTPNGTILSPYDKTKPCVQLGNGTQLIDYISFSDMSLIGDGQSFPNSDGLRVYGATNCFYNNFHVYNFGRNNIVFDSNGTYHSYKQYFNNVVSSEAYGSCVYVNDNYGGISFCNFNFIPRTTTGAYAISIFGNGAMLQLSNGYIDWSDGHCINTTGTPQIHCANVIWDLISGQANGIMIKSDQPSSVQYTCLDGVYYIDNGQIQYTDITIPFNLTVLPLMSMIDAPYFAHDITLQDKVTNPSKVGKFRLAPNGEIQFEAPSAMKVSGNDAFNTLNVWGTTPGSSGGVRIYSYMADGTTTRWARWAYNANGNQMVFASSNGASLDLGGTWQTPIVMNGTNFLWVDTTGKLRIKSATKPTSDTDGVVVGSQT